MTDGEWLAGLYDAHAGALYGYLLHLTGREADTQDLLQDVFVRLAQRRSAWATVRDARAYLLRLAHHAFIDLVRRRDTRDRHHAAFAEAAPRLFDTAADADTAAFRQALEEALFHLPADQRAVVHLKLWEGLTFDAIARLLELPLNTVASRYRYAVDKLRDRLRPLYDEVTRP